jgi:hypothetical protein
MASNISNATGGSGFSVEYGSLQFVRVELIKESLRQQPHDYPNHDVPIMTDKFLMGSLNSLRPNLISLIVSARSP